MLTRFVRIQLAIFTIASIIGMTMMVITYMQAPTLLGMGRITVKLELSNSGGLYRFANVTLRGVQVGKVTGVDFTRAGAEATLSLDNSPRIPANLRAEVRSVSAVGEQYVDLLPRAASPPYLRDGSVIAAKDTTIPQAVGPMLDQVSALVESIPKDKLSALLDESFKGLNGAGYDFGSLIDSTSTIAGDLNAVADRARTLIDDSGPLLDSQAQTTDAIRIWARSLAGVTQQVAMDDPQIRNLLKTGPGFAQDVARLLEQVKPTLPVLLANLTTIGQVGVTYNPALQQLLVLLPPYVAALQSYGAPHNNATGSPVAEFSAINGDPLGCTVGFLPPSQWRSPADTTTIDTPDNLYCKLPQDSPIAVRGARNYPCMGHPGKRAPTVQICDSDKPYEPLAMRQHFAGPYPLDPNLISQGVPPDDRITFSDHEFGPVEGTPLPPGIPGGTSPPGAPVAPLPPGSPGVAPPPAALMAPQSGDIPSIAPLDLPSTPPHAEPPPAAEGTAPTAAPSSSRESASRVKPSVAVAEYDPGSGRYLDANGHSYTQSNLATTVGPKTWKELILSEH
jgi:virulence factor Mce-like protein